MEQINLNGDWEFTLVDEEEQYAYYPAKVPGVIHLDLIDNDIIEDPFVARNELRYQWIGTRDWNYRKTFKVKKETLAKSRIELFCDGLDTIATIRINGKKVGYADNMFRRWTFPVKDALKVGENKIEIDFQAPMTYVAQSRDRVMGPMPATNDRIGGSPYIRKAPYQFGWDWGPRFVTMGIWKPIEIVATDEAAVDLVSTVMIEDKKDFDLKVTLDVNSPIKTKAKIVYEIAGAKVSREIEIDAGQSEIKEMVRVSNPQRWWPNGQGEAKLYDLAVTFKAAGSEEQTFQKKIGFRTVKLVNESDGDGVSFYFEINGKPIFCKGANWIPSDSFPSRVSEKKYRSLLESAAECNMNMIRVWGGGIYENEIFYELCDELGLMVWQDFMFACSLYPSSKSFMENIAIEAEQNIKRLSNHASIVLWCGNNECETGLKHWYKAESAEGRSYRKVFHELLPDTCYELDPSRPYWPASPHSIESRNPGTVNDGDSHEWSVWHGSKPFEYFRSVKARFCSEFGFQSFPEIKTIRSYAAAKDLNLTEPDVAFHQKNSGGNERILMQMHDRFRLPNSFGNFVELSQLQQAYAIQVGVEHWRKSRPVCMGTLYWQLNDCWPVASWSSIDYFGRWKALQYFSKRFYAPLLVTSFGDYALDSLNDPIAKKTDIYIVSDNDHFKSAKLTWTVMSFAGNTLKSGTVDFSMNEAQSLYLTTLKEDDLADWFGKKYSARNSFVHIKVEVGGQVTENVHHFAHFKDLELPKAKLEIKTKNVSAGVEVTVSSDVFAKWVHVTAIDEKQESRFSDNFFDLIPGQSKTILYKGSMPKSFSATSLVDTYK